MRIKLAVIIGTFLFGTGVFLENSLMRTGLGIGSVSSAQELSGKDLYMESCARCHGQNGESGKGPNLTTAKKKAKWADSDARIVEQITKGGLIMPAFGKKLSAEKIEAIASYVRALPPTASK
ncbi:MAG: cytochrome c [Acidobacteriota bacterium]